MTKIKDFFSTHKYAIIWTVCYIIAMWSILYFLFNFNMLSTAQWHHLARAELHGFAGFVFGLLLLSALPLYIATTTLIIRNKKPLIEIPTPKIQISKLWSTPQVAPSPTPIEPATPAPDTDAPTPQNELSEEIPAEIRNAFIRARNNIGQIQTSAFNMLAPTAQPVPVAEPVTDITTKEIPLPNDFELGFDEITPSFSDIPTFSEIDFGDAPDTITTTTPESPTEPAPQQETAPETPGPTSDDYQILTTHLDQTSRAYTITDDIVITDEFAIATHSDPDFWVADTENWFAAGKTRPSPIQSVKKIATLHKRTPAIYLASKNILDLDNLVDTWTNDGIAVFTDLTQI